MNDNERTVDTMLRSGKEEALRMDDAFENRLVQEYRNQRSKRWQPSRIVAVLIGLVFVSGASLTVAKNMDEIRRWLNIDMSTGAVDVALDEDGNGFALLVGDDGTEIRVHIRTSMPEGGLVDGEYEIGDYVLLFVDEANRPDWLPPSESAEVDPTKRYLAILKKRATDDNGPCRAEEEIRPLLHSLRIGGVPVVPPAED